MEKAALSPIFLKLDDVRPHEDVEEPRLSLLTSQISEVGQLLRPIAIDRKTKTILDGHHRVAALRRLGCHFVPVYEFDYMDPDIAVVSWRNGDAIDKSAVVSAALSGRIFPPKTTKHVVRMNGVLVHISEAEIENPTPLSLLK